jgi:flavin-dependent dehydrogenase
VLCRAGVDALVIGGGPAGVSAAITLRQAGREVLLLERARFPRYHIGESLIPGAVQLLQALGLDAAVAAAGFVEKPGARFYDASDGLDLALTFRDAPAGVSFPLAWQVERDRFDALLLEGAAAQGVEVLCPAAVTAVRPGPDSVVVEAEVEGARRTFEVPAVVDASGHKSLVAKTFGLRTHIPRLKTHACFGYARGLSRAPGPDGGNVVIGFAPGGWLWGIPLTDGVTSLGVVLTDAAQAQEDLRDPRAVLVKFAQAYLPYPEDIAAHLFGEVRAYGAINYCARRYALDRVVLAGDAAAFLDPVFSTGVFLGLQGGREAGQAVAEGLARGDLSAAAFEGYQRRLRLLHHVSLELILMFYQGRFGKLLRAMAGRPELMQEVVGLLAGDLLSERGMVSRALMKRANPDVPLAEA